MAYFQQTEVHDRVKTFFSSVLQHDRLAHAYLFHGAAGSGQTAFAFELARVLNCSGEGNKPCGQCPSCLKIARLNHPDVKYVFPATGKIYDSPRQLLELQKQKAAHPFKALPVSGYLNIPISAIRALKEEAKYAPYEAVYRVFIVEGIEYMSREAANSFLKLLEEPPEKMVIILITGDINNVLDTIRSRCQPVYFPALPEEAIRQIVSREFPDSPVSTGLIRAKSHNIEHILETLEKEAPSYEEQASDFLRAAIRSDWVKLNEIIDSLIQKKDKHITDRFYETLTQWLADAFHLRHLADEAELYLENQRAAGEKFAGHYDHLDYKALITLIERHQAMMKQNARPDMTLSHLAMQIKEHLAKARENQGNV